MANSPGYMQAWRAANKEKIAAYNKQYAAENPRKSTKRDPAKAKAQRDAWKAANLGWHTEYNRRYSSERYKGDPLFALKMRERTRVRQGLKVQGTHKAGPTAELLGCTWIEFFRHIESLFADGMSWQNMNEWHVDHVKPLAQFDLSDPEQQKLAFHYKNHQPLWALDNLKKGAR